MAKSKLVQLITGYEDNIGTAVGSHIGRKFYAKKISGSVTANTKRFLSSKLMKFFKKLADLFAYAPAKTYGALFMTFGLLSLIINFATDYFGSSGQMSLASLVVGAAFAVVSVPFLLVDTPVSVMLQGFKPTEVIFFEFFCIKRLFYTGTEKGFNPLFGAFAGALLAILGAFISPEWVAIGMGILLFVAVSFNSPEFTFFSTLLLLPYVSLLPYSSVILASAATLGVISFMRKTLFGKRVVFFEQYDALLTILVIGILISGIFVKGIESFVGALLTVSAVCGYFMASNTVTNRRLADCAINAVVISSLPASAISFVKFIGNALSGSPLDFLEHGISSTFSEADSAAAFFLVATIFSYILVKQSQGALRGAYAALMLLDVAALIMTGQFMSIIALVLACGAYRSIKSGKWMLLIMPLLLVLPYFLLFIPADFINSLPIKIIRADTLNIFSASLSAFGNNFLFGIGMGSDSFAKEMQNYGIDSATDCGNIFLELALEAGIFASTAFLLLLLARLVHRASYQRYIRQSQVSKLSPFMSMTVFALLVFGGFDHVFCDTTVFYLFWCVFGIGSGALRVAKAEHDDRVLYFEDEKSSESAVANFYIR